MKKILLSLLTLAVLAILAILLFFKSDAKNPYPETRWGRFSGTCAAEDAPKDNFGKNFHSCDYTVSKEEIPVFKKAALSWDNTFDNTKSLPLMGSAMIDVNGDGVDELFLSGGVTQQDVLLVYSDCLLYTSPSPRDLSTSRMPSSA